MHGRGTMNWADGSNYTGTYKMGEYEMGNFTTKKGNKQKVGGGKGASMAVSGTRR